MFIVSSNFPYNYVETRYQEGISVERHRGIYLQEKLEGCSVDRGMQISGGFLISCRPRLNAA